MGQHFVIVVNRFLNVDLYFQHHLWHEPTNPPLETGATNPTFQNKKLRR